MSDVISEIFLSFLLYGALIFTYLFPEESLLLGRRWLFKEEPNLTDRGILFTKYVSVIGIFLLTIGLIRSIFNDYLISNILIVGLILYIFIKGLKLIRMN